MSNRLLTLLAIGVAFAPAHAVSAQTTSRDADSLLRRIRALDSAVMTRSRSVDSIRRMLVRPIPNVDIQEGPIHVRTDATLAPRVRSAVSSVVEMIDRRVWTWVASRASAHVAVIRRDSTRSIVGMLPVIAFDADTTTRWSLIGER